MARGRRLVRAAGIGLVLAFALTLTPGVASQPPNARGASPSPPIVPPGDTRSEGEGAGLVGSPVLVALGVILLGAGTAGLTIIYLKLRSH